MFAGQHRPVRPVRGTPYRKEVVKSSDKNMSYSKGHSVIEAAEEVYEDDTLDELYSCLYKQSDQLPYSFTCIPRLLDSYKQTTMINQLSSMPSYQATLLLTEYHLMMEETGPLPLHLRHNLATQSLFQSVFSEKFQAFENETRNLKNFDKCNGLIRSWLTNLGQSINVILR